MLKSVINDCIDYFKEKKVTIAKLLGLTTVLTVITTWLSVKILSPILWSYDGKLTNEQVEIIGFCIVFYFVGMFIAGLLFWYFWNTTQFLFIHLTTFMIFLSMFGLSLNGYVKTSMICSMFMMYLILTSIIRRILINHQYCKRVFG